MHLLMKTSKEQQTSQCYHHILGLKQHCLFNSMLQKQGVASLQEYSYVLEYDGMNIP